jgi:hypothetical protein
MKMLLTSPGCLGATYAGKKRFLAFAAIFILLTARVGAFSLLGPYANWMDVEKGYQLPGDIGGPMNITEGYRWNMPVITYGFDRSFLDYFGSNGVAAVEQAITMLNQIPPASSLNLDDYALHAWRANWQAEALALVDLKSQTLGLLLEQMGLADPVRYAFCVRDFFTYPGQDYTFVVIVRNFDATTAEPSHWVNQTLLTFQVAELESVPTPGEIFCFANSFPVDAQADFEPILSLNSGMSSPYGRYVTNLTREDVAGLRYLLSGNQVRCESLSPDVYLVNTNDGPLVVTADRPGVEKITLVRHPAGSLNGRFMPFTNQWTDIYYDFDFPVYQQVERVTTQPDIIFRAQDLGPSTMVDRTGTTNWINNADLNGNPGGVGPGVIQGPVTITFNSIGPFYYTGPRINTNTFPNELDSILVAGWGSFCGTSNAPITYPIGQAPFQPTIIHVTFQVDTAGYDLHWPVAARAYQFVALQTTTNLTDWITLTTLTNSGARFDYQFSRPAGESARFFRAAPLP